MSVCLLSVTAVEVGCLPAGLRVSRSGCERLGSLWCSVPVPV